MNKYANIGSRFLASLVDGLILNVINGALFYVFIRMAGVYAFENLWGYYGNLTELDYFKIMTGWKYFPVYLILSALIGILYFALFESSVKGGTLGKMLLGIKVVDGSDRRIPFGTALVRSLSRYLSSILYIGYIMAFFDDAHQTLHDKIAGTYVISSKYSYTEIVVKGRQSSPAPVYTPPQQPKPAATPKLVAVSGQLAGMSFPIDSRGIMIGRDPSCCGVVVNKDTAGISRHHCTVSYNTQTGMFIVNDCGSSYGTFTASGMRVMNGQPVALNNGERFYLGSPANSFELRIS